MKSFFNLCLANVDRFVALKLRLINSRFIAPEKI